MKNTNEITPLVITDGLDIFQAHDLIDTLSGYKGTEAAIYAIENWVEENALAFAIKYANEGNADDAAALLEIYDGEGDDDWADVIGAIDKARNAEWLNRSWLEIKSRTIPVAGRDDLRRIERAAAIAGATVSDYGVDDDDNPTDATILAPADKIEILNQLEKHFTAPAEEPAADDADDAGDIFDRLVAAWRATANEDLDLALQENGRDTENDPTNLYRAGVFAGLAEAAAWMIYATITPEDDADDINAITAAVYKAYGVAW